MNGTVISNEDSIKILNAERLRTTRYNIYNPNIYNKSVAVKIKMI